MEDITVTEISPGNTHELSRKDSIWDARILVVDDSEASRILVEEIFRMHGFLAIELAESAEEAVKKAAVNPPDLVMLDLLLPGMDGFELCRLFRRNPKLANAVILMQTSSKERSHLAEAFQAGVSDFVTKPLNVDEVMARAAVHLERYMLHRRLEAYRKRTSEELYNARKMQDAILPSATLVEEIRRDYRLEVSAHFEPCSEVGGDFWGMHRIAPEEIAVYCADLVGHGVTAALNAFRVQMLLQQAGDDANQPAAYLARLNDYLAGMMDTGQYATLFYGVINTERHTLRCTSAGALPPVLYSAAMDNSTLLHCAGVPLGAVRGTRYEENTHPFHAGDTLLLYSDALVETADKHGVCLPEDMLAMILTRYGGKSAGNILKHLLEESVKYRDGMPLADDLTVVVCRFL